MFNISKTFKRIVSASAAAACLFTGIKYVPSESCIKADAADISANQRYASDENFYIEQGDINGDGEFTIADFVMMQRYLLNSSGVDLVYWEAGDLSGDGKITSADLTLMRKKLTNAYADNHNILQDSDNWRYHIIEGNAVFNLNKKENSITATVKETSTENWQIESQVCDLSLKKDTSYLLLFDASCTSNNNLEIGLSRKSDGYPNYFCETVALKRYQKHYTFLIKDLPESYDDYYVSFEYGTALGEYSIENLKLVEVTRSMVTNMLGWTVSPEESDVVSVEKDSRTGTITADVKKIDPSQVVQLRYRGLTLERGKEYVISYTVSSPQNGGYSELLQESGGLYRQYHTDIVLTDPVAERRHIVVVPNHDCENAKLAFNFKSPGIYKFENIKLVEVKDVDFESIPVIPQTTTTAVTTSVTTTSVTTTSVTTTAVTTTTKVRSTAQPPIEWSRNNWNFDNIEGDFPKVTYSKLINEKYLAKLKESLDEKGIKYVFKGDNPLIDRLWSGSCYGMSALVFLANNGLMPYSDYKSGADCLYSLPAPKNSMDVSSLITYYHILQTRDIIQQQYRTVKYKSNQDNIEKIIELLNKNSCVLVGYGQEFWGSHAVIAYDYEYGSWKRDGKVYDGRIHILDPNSSSNRDEEYFIYFDSEKFFWNVPAEILINSDYGAYFNYIGANIDEINEGGYLSGTSKSSASKYIGRLDTYSIARHSVYKYSQQNDKDITINNSTNDIIPSVSFYYEGDSEGVAGYDLLDAEASYIVSQFTASELQLSIDYENCLLEAGSEAGTRVMFDKKGFIRLESESADYNLSMVFNEDYPTDWFAFDIKGEDASKVIMTKKEDGYILQADNLENVRVEAYNRTESSEVSFTTKYRSVLLYEIDVNTIGVAVDADGNGTYETTIARTEK